MSDRFFTFEVLAAIWAGLSLLALIAGLVKWDPVGRIGGHGYRASHQQPMGLVCDGDPRVAYLPGHLLFESHTIIFVGNIAIAMWVAHYGHRTLIWPWVIPRRDGEMRIMMCASGIFFNVLNGALWGWFMGYIADYASDWMSDPRFVIGVVLAIGGGALNIWSDYRLWRLRGDNRDAYVIPRGGVFNLVSCPNLAGRNN